MKCNKVTYGSRKNAKRAAKRLYPGQTMHVYRCPKCEKRRKRSVFHFTSMNAEQSRQMREMYS